MKEEAIQLNNQGVQYFLQQQWEKAEACYDKAHQADPENAAVLNNMGLLWHQKKDYEQAIVFFQKASSLDNKPNYLVNEGNARAMGGKYEEARDKYKQALSLQEDYEEALISLAKLLTHLQNYQEAETYYRKLVQLVPKQEYHYDLGLLYINMRDYSNALSVLYPLAQNTHSAEAWFQVGRCEFLMKNHGLAEKALKTALAERPDHRDFRHFLALNYLAMGQVEDALHHLDMVLKLYPDDHELLTEKGVVFCGLQDFTSAMDLFHQALKIKPDYSKAVHYRDMIAKKVQ